MYNLKGVGLNREDAHSYQLSKKVHKEKTSEVDFILPTAIKTIPNAFIYNGDSTISFLQKVWDEGKLTHSVESMAVFKKSIRECIKGDIADFHDKKHPV